MIIRNRSLCNATNSLAVTRFTEVYVYDFRGLLSLTPGLFLPTTAFSRPFVKEHFHKTTYFAIYIYIIRVCRRWCVDPLRTKFAICSLRLTNMDHGSGTLTRDINLRQYALIQTCTKRKPILKSGAVFDAECLFLYKIFKSHFDSLLVALRDHLQGGERAFVKVELVLYMITQFESSINLAMRHLNDSVSPLFRRSDEPSVVLLIILHQDMCALATYLDSELLPYFKTVHTEVIEAVTKEYSLIHAMRRICQLVQDKLTTTIPIIAMRIEEALYAKVSDTVSSVMTKICGPSHFLPPMESDINVLLGEGIVVGCLEPAAVLLERYGEALCAQRVVTVAVKATMVRLFLY